MNSFQILDKDNNPIPNNGSKIELLRDHYSPENPMRFYEFNGESPNCHGHFGEIYTNAGVDGGSWGGDQSGAVYVWPIRISHGKIVCQLIGRGCFAHYDNVLQILNEDSCVFYDINGDVIPWEETYDQYILAAKFSPINQFNYRTFPYDPKVVSWKEAYSNFRYIRNKRWLIRRKICKERANFPW